MPNFNGRETAAEVNLVFGLRARGKVKRWRRLCRNRGGGGGNDQGKQTTTRRRVTQSRAGKKSTEGRWTGNPDADRHDLNREMCATILR